MGPTRRATCLTAVAIIGFASMATATTASASLAGSTAHRAKGCIAITDTIPLGSRPEPFWVAVDQKTNTIYVTNDEGCGSFEGSD